MIILYLFGILVTLGVIKYMIIPVLLAIAHGCYDGWNGTTEYKALYCLEDDEIEDSEDITVLDEIVHLEVLINRNIQASSYIEKELELTYNEKKRITLLSKLNTLDNQSFKYKARIAKLKEKLE